MSGEIAFTNTALESFRSISYIRIAVLHVLQRLKCNVELNMLHRRMQRGIH